MRTDAQAWREALQSESKLSKPLLTTKLAIPAVRAGLVSRARLTDRLELSAAHRLLLVGAPAGWGKTSLLSEWIARHKSDRRSIVWVSLDPDDNDPTRFLLYLTSAFGRAHPGLGEAAHCLLLSPQPAPPDVILTVLLNELSALDRPLAVVLDDYHLIEDRSVHEAVTFLLEHLPPSVHLVLATRSDPPLPLSRLRARGQLLEIRADDLRFNHEEAAAFLNQAMGLNLGSEAVSRLEARTEGWIAGLQLAALSLQGRENPSELIDSVTGSNRYIVDYLFDEVLARQSKEVQTFLVETSILNRLCGPLCDALVGRGGGQALLELLETANLFLIPLDTERRWYRYHHLFADVLRARLARQGEERTAELHGRAAGWYAQQGLVEAAVHHALEGKHLTEAVRLIELYSDAIWMQGGQRTLEQWLKALPAECIKFRPGLSTLQAALYAYDFRLPEALETLDACRAAVPAAEAWTQDLRGRAAVICSDIARFRDDFDEAAAFAREAIACLSRQSPLWRGSALQSLGVSLYEGDHLLEADEALAEAIANSREEGNIHTFVLSSIVHGQLHERQGELRDAAQIYMSALAYATEHGYHHVGEVALLHAGLGRVHYKWNDLAAAESFLNAGLQCRHPVYPAACNVDLLRVRQAQGDPDRVMEVVRQLEAAVRQGGFRWLPAAVAALKVRLNPQNQKAAAAWAREFENRPPDTRPLRMPHDLRELELVTWAHVRLAEGSAALVQARLESQLEILIGQGRYGSAIELRLLLTMLYCQQGLTDLAVKSLEPALALADKEGYVRVFLDAGKSFLPVLRESAARGIELEAVTILLDAFRTEGLSSIEQPHDTSSLSRPLSYRELEVLRLIAAGLSNPEIAEHLFLSVGTIKRHVHNLFIKLDVTNRVNALERARSRKIL